jgi:hypothetical protein
MSPYPALIRPYVPLSGLETFTIHHPDWVAVPPFDFAREIVIYSRIEGERDQYRAQTINLGQVLKLVAPTTAAARADETGGNGA